MAVVGRSLMVGLFAWILGNGALVVFPARSLHLDRVGDWMSMLLFSPLEIFLSLFLFVLATLLLIGLLRFHITQYYYQKSSQTVWIHVLLSIFSAFVLGIQFFKMPIATMTMISVCGLYFLSTRGYLFLGKRRN